MYAKIVSLNLLALVIGFTILIICYKNIKIKKVQNETFFYPLRWNKTFTHRLLEDFFNLFWRIAFIKQIMDLI